MLGQQAASNRTIVENDPLDVIARRLEEAIAQYGSEEEK